jgi:hypothetical protein
VGLNEGRYIVRPRYDPSMDAPLEKKFLFAEGQPILSLAEFQRFAYGLPEDAVPPEVLTRWVAGEEFEPSRLLACFEEEAAEAAASSDESLEVLRLAADRLKRAFPDAAT